MAGIRRELGVTGGVVGGGGLTDTKNRPRERSGAGCLLPWYELRPGPLSRSRDLAQQIHKHCQLDTVCFLGGFYCRWERKAHGGWEGVGGMKRQKSLKEGRALLQMSGRKT